VPGVDDVEAATAQPPAAGRAGVRGRAIRRLHPNRSSYVCSWDSIRSRTEVLDLSNPFVSREHWRTVPGAPQRPLGRLDQRQPAPGGLSGWSSVASGRGGAARAIGQFLRDCGAGIEQLYFMVLFEDHARPTVLLQLATARFASARYAAARRKLDRAWGTRAEAEPHVVGRLLWFQALFAMVDGVDAATWLGQLKWHLEDDARAPGWDTRPLLARARPRLSHQQYGLLEALSDALSDTGLAEGLERFPAWRLANPRPVEVARA
jgi:hypothetical protein